MFFIYTSPAALTLLISPLNDSEKPMSEIKKDLEVLWTVHQVADYFSLSKGTIYQWLTLGKFKPEEVVRISNKVRITRSAVERLAGKIKSEIQEQ